MNSCIWGKSVTQVTQPQMYFNICTVAEKGIILDKYIPGKIKHLVSIATLEFCVSID